MVDDEFRELVEDIRAHGLREPIVLYEGKIRTRSRSSLRTSERFGGPRGSARNGSPS